MVSPDQLLPISHLPQLDTPMSKPKAIIMQESFQVYFEALSDFAIREVWVSFVMLQIEPFFYH